MSSAPTDPGPYTLNRLRGQLLRQGPELVRHLPQLVSGLVGPHGLGAPSRLAVQLRMTRLMGCPVCLGIFPRLGPKLGLDSAAVDDALEGRIDQLPPQVAGAVAWAEELFRSDGVEPEVVPSTAMALTQGQRDHLRFLVRMELLVHATGLMFLPHGAIKRAAGL